MYVGLWQVKVETVFQGAHHTASCKGYDLAQEATLGTGERLFEGSSCKMLGL